MPFAGHALELRERRAPRTQVLTRSPGRAACWTRARRSALPVRSRARRCARRSRRCRRRGPRTRRCATRRAPRCRAPALRRGLPWRSGSLAAGRRTSRETRLPMCSPRGHENVSSCDRTTASCASSSACQSRSPISAARCVESTMSVNSTVARTRSSATSAWWPVRNSAISWKDGRHGSTKWINVAPRNLNVFRARYVIGDVLAPFGRDQRVVGVVEH